MIFGQNSALVIRVLKGKIGEKQMMIDDDDIALHRPLMHQRNEAALVIRALLAGAEIGARIHLGPRRAGFGQRFDFGPVAEFGGLFPFADGLEIRHFLQTGEHWLLIHVVDFLAAGVVGAAFHVADFEWPRKVLLQERNVLEKELLLQVLGAGGDYDALARKQRWNQVG